MTVSPCLHVLPADERLGRIEALIGNRMRKEEILRDALGSLAGYDAVVIDCAPSLSVLHANAFSTATDVLLPVSLDLLSISGANAVLSHLDDFRRYCGYGPMVAGVLPTIFDGRRRVERELLELVQKVFGGLHVYDPIRTDTKIIQSTLHGGDIFAAKRLSRAALDYRAFVHAFVGRRWPAMWQPGQEHANAS